MRRRMKPGTVVRFPITNHDFDDGMNGWVFDAPAGLTTTQVEVHSRVATAEIFSSGRVSQTVAVDLNTNYTLSTFTRGPARFGVVLGGSELSDTDNNSSFRFSRMSFSSGSNSVVTIFGETIGSAAYFDSWRLISHAAPQ